MSRTMLICWALRSLVPSAAPSSSLRGGARHEKGRAPAWYGAPGTTPGLWATVVSPGNRNACHAEAFQPLADLAMRKPHATIACRGRTSDGYIPDLRVATVPIVIITGSSFGRLGAFPKKRPNRATWGARPGQVQEAAVWSWDRPRPARQP